MLRSLSKSVLLAAVLVGAVACSDSKGSVPGSGALNNNKLQGGTPDGADTQTDTATTGADTTALRANPWCLPGADDEQRFVFKAGGALNFTKFDLINGQRTNPQETASTWSVAGTVLTIGPKANGLEGEYRINAQQLILSYRGNDIPFAACN